ncbi:hypothetical protein BHE74_00034888 [Ensete ventricosum]|nr:hypothetical protein GW17_00021666 [Ensete ventricosum]RWW58315.1 hypothetical protein BHE74_00034888 [Ensete ventricosum]RZS17246.1 hypothetical protein BHM03_00049363 [Ensete ventricosum]
MPRDKWFNLALRDCPAALENFDIWRKSNLEPLVIDIILIRRALVPNVAHPLGGCLLRNFSGNCDLALEPKSGKIVERWIVQYERHKSSSSKNHKDIRKCGLGVLRLILPKHTLSLHLKLRHVPLKCHKSKRKTKRSPDAVVGAVVRMLTTAAPLRQDLSNLCRPSQVFMDESLNPCVQHDRANTEQSECPASTSETSASVLLKSKTAAEGLEELRRYKEMKESILKQGASRSSDVDSGPKSAGNNDES